MAVKMALRIGAHPVLGGGYKKLNGIGSMPKAAVEAPGFDFFALHRVPCITETAEDPLRIRIISWICDV